MSYNVEITNRQRHLQLNRAGIKALVSWVLQAEGREEAEVSLLFVGDQAIRKINQQYLRRDYPTDVLAFPQLEETETGFHSLMLGDVVISTQRVVEQAPEYRETAEDELGRYLIHGILHLLGYRDHPAPARRRMRQREEKLLSILKRKRKWSLIKS